MFLTNHLILRGDKGFSFTADYDCLNGGLLGFVKFLFQLVDNSRVERVHRFGRLQ